MKKFEIRYQYNDGVKWCIASRIVFANSPEDAVKKMDMYTKLIICVELL